MFVVAALSAAAITTCTELIFRFGRSPFADRPRKAPLWWFSVIAIDVLVVGMFCLGLLAPVGVTLPDGKGASPWVAGFAAGVLLPLALRSPIRKAEIKGREVPVGFTYIYDAGRARLLYSLDDRMSWILRQDVVRLRDHWLSRNVTAEGIRNLILEHMENHPSVTPLVREEVEKSTRKACKFPEEGLQVDALIKIIKARRFIAIIDHLGKP